MCTLHNFFFHNWLVLMENTVFFGNVIGVDPSEIEEFFSQFGELKEMKIVRRKDRRSDSVRFHGFIEMTSAEDAEALISAANGVEFGDKEIICEKALHPPRKSTPTTRTKKRRSTRRIPPYLRITGFPSKVLVADVVGLFPESSIQFVKTSVLQSGEFRVSVRCDSIEATRALAETEDLEFDGAPLELELIGDDEDIE
eukprot:gnl/Chilomastix_cuspidata/524.p1 GENE.gnl/Chilomastix_cuspidata/524~~gnl/Chilomastix_cuspidata/524.p1  ORF type:complete len:213 (+),score=58.53 gnl/Chilomastix_cuspidata/524:47-640(+)